MATPRYRSFLGIAKETALTPGSQPTSVAATDYIPVMDLKPFDNIKMLEDLNWRGSMVKDYGLVQGNIYSEFEFNGDVFPDTAGYFYAGLLGDYAQSSPSALTINNAVYVAATGSTPGYTIFTTSTAHNLSVGQTVTTASVTSSPTGNFNFTSVPVSAVPSTTSFVITGTLPATTYTSGGTATPAAIYYHSMAVKNSGNGQATSYSLTDYNGYNARVYAGCQFGSVDTKFTAEGLLEYTAMAQGFASNAFAQITSATSNGSTVVYTAVNNFNPGNIVTITGNSAATLNLTGQTVTSATPTQFVVTNSVSATTGTGGSASVATPTAAYSTVIPVPVWTGVTTIGSSVSVSGATASGSAVTYTTSTAHNLIAGQTVFVSNITSSVVVNAFNLGLVTVASVPSSTTFTVTSSVSASATYTSGGTVSWNATAKLAEGNINVSRPLSPIFTVDGSQNPYQIFQGAVEVTGALKLVYEDDVDLLRFLNNTQPTLDVTFTQGAGTTQTTAQYRLSKCAFEVAKIDRSKDYVELDVTFKGIANTTDVGASLGYSPIKITLKNAKTTAVYA